MLAIFLAVGAISLFIFSWMLVIPIAVAFFAYKYWRQHPSTVGRNELETLRQLHKSVEYLADRIELPDAEDFSRTVISHVSEILDSGEVPDFMHKPIEEMSREVLALAGLEPVPPWDEDALRASVDRRNAHRLTLERLRETYAAGDGAVDSAFSYICQCVGETCESMPTNGLGTSRPIDLQADVLDMIGDPKALGERLLKMPFYDDYASPALEAVRNRTVAHLAATHATTTADIDKKLEAYTRLSEVRGDPHTVVLKNLGGSPAVRLLKGRVGFRIPAEARFEHTHVIAGSGHGKTQMIQRFIREDLEAMVGGVGGRKRRSVVVIDGQGDLIDTIMSRSVFATDGLLANQIIVIDPADIVPIALNMFDVGQEQINKLPPRDREMIFNGTVELYSYLFGELLKAELTQKQDVLFNFLARLMLSIPKATLITLRDVLQDGQKYASYIATLDTMSQEFFQTQFFGKEFEDTKQQLARRLWGILANNSLSAMFNSDTNKVDLFKELQSEKVILISTAKEFLKTDGSRIFGRFWIALLVQAALRRSILSPRDRIDTHVYIDEAHEYISEDTKTEELLNQARKYRIGLTLAHQNIEQLSKPQRATVSSSTAIKMIGGASHLDAKRYHSDLRTDVERIMATKKDGDGSEFVIFVRNTTPQGMTVKSPFGTLEDMPAMGAAGVEALRERVRAQYGSSAAERPSASPAAAAPSQAPERPTVGGFELGDHEAL